MASILQSPSGVFRAAVPVAADLGVFGPQPDLVGLDDAERFLLWRAQTKGQSIGGCESRPRKPPEERGSKFSGVG